MIKKSSTAISGILAFAIYFTVIAMLIFYFNTRDEKKSKRYVKKDEHRIQVALSAPKKSSKPKVVKKKVKPKPKPKKKRKKKPKPKKKQTVKKKVIKEKVVKKVVKKKDENLTKPKKVNKAKDLFANISSTKKPKLKLEITDKPIKPKKSDLIKIVDKPSASNLVSNSLKKQKQMDSGVPDAYLAKVQSLLEGWPAQSEYAGEKVKVILYINPTGFFEFKIKSASNNPRFNAGLTEYLEQLQEFGFGRHKGNRTYNFEAEFIAKE